jgi:hypothetical protein
MLPNGAVTVTDFTPDRVGEKTTSLVLETGRFHSGKLGVELLNGEVLKITLL